MYLEHFGLLQEPFSIAPDPAFLFLSEAHNEAFAHLLYGFNHGGFVLISGEVGTGKTTLLRNLLHRTPENIDVAFVLNPRLTARELLETLCDELHVDYPDTPLDSVKQYVDALTTHLLKTHAEGRSTVVIIDEAQILTPAVLEQVRLLTNLETNEKKLLRIILLGQPELVDMLNKKELRQLSQRVTARYHLTPLNRRETADYVSHRLARAGGNPSIFTSGAVARLYRLSKGTPRLINILADRAMLGAYTRNEREVTAALIDGAAREVFGVSHRSLRPLMIAGGALLVLIAVGLGAWWFLPAGAPNTAVSAPEAGREPIVQTPPAAPPRAQPRPAQIPAVAPARATTPQVETPATVTTTADAVASTDPTVESSATSVERPQAPTGSVSVRRPLGAGFRTHRAAFRRVFAAWGAEYAPGESLIPCDFAPRVGLQCLSRSGGWSEVAQLNTPVVMELWDEQTTPFYGALTDRVTASDGNLYYRLQVADEALLVQPRDLRDHWFGAYVLLWQTPPDYHGSLRAGDAHPSVRWLRDSLAQIMPEAQIDTNSSAFDESLHEAVLDFQRDENLLADGVVGPLTWIRLSDRLNLPAPKLIP